MFHWKIKCLNSVPHCMHLLIGCSSQQLLDIVKTWQKLLYLGSSLCSILLKWEWCHFMWHLKGKPSHPFLVEMNYLHIWENHLKIWIRDFKHQSMKKWYSISIYWISRVASFSQIVSLTEAFLEASLRNYIILYYLFQTRIFLTGRPPSPTDPAPDVSYSYYPPSSSRSSCFGWLFSASSGFKLALGCSASWTSLI